MRERKHLRMTFAVLTWKTGWMLLAEIHNSGERVYLSVGRASWSIVWTWLSLKSYFGTSRWTISESNDKMQFERPGNLDSGVKIMSMSKIANVVVFLSEESVYKAWGTLMFSGEQSKRDLHRGWKWEVREGEKRDLKEPKEGETGQKGGSCQCHFWDTWKFFKHDQHKDGFITIRCLYWP